MTSAGCSGMLRAMTDRYQIQICSSAELRPALSLVLRTLPADQRAPLVDSLARLQGEPLGAFAALAVAKRGEELSAAAWGQPQPGKGCSLWTPQAETGNVAPGLAAPLIDRVTSVADAAGVAVTQTLTELPQGPMHAPLTQCGFRRVAELKYLEWKVQPCHRTPDSKILFEAFDPKRQRRLESVVAETYQGTLDFPELDGMRRLNDVMYGYQCIGEFQPDLWEILTLDGRDIGVLLLTEYPATRQLELVYMGIVPAARGQAAGAVAVNRAQAVACRRGVDRLVLAVDARNDPAQAIYQRAGFRPWARRYAYLRPRHGSLPPG